MSITYDERRDAQRDVYGILAKMREENCESASLQSNGPHSGVMHTIFDLVAEAGKSDDTAIRGKLLTRIMRLPSHQSSLLREFVNVSPAYRGMDPRLSVTLENIGDQTVPVTTQVRIMPHLNPATGEELDTWDTEVLNKSLEPGEEVTLPAERAIQLMHARCQEAWNPSARGWPHEHDDIREIGFSCNVDGEEVRVTA